MKPYFFVIIYIILHNLALAQCPDGFITDKQNLVINGDFSDGNTGFSSHYKWHRRHSYKDGPMLPEATYSIVYNPKYIHWRFDRCYDHSGHGSMMVVNGNPMINKYIWKQYIKVKKNTTYFFSCWIASANKIAPAKLQFSIDDKKLGEPILASATTCEWKQFATNWESGNAEEISISIVNQNLAKTGNDFILDDITFYECVTPDFDKQLQDAQIGSTVDLREIYFETGNSQLKIESFSQLDKLAGYLNKNISVEIEISGHTDNVGEEENNLRLSEERCATIAEYIANKGIATNRFTAKGYGESQPIESNETFEGRQINRRVEFKILKK